MPAKIDFEELRTENLRLIALFERHGIERRLPEKIEVEPEPFVLLKQNLHSLALNRKN